MDNFMEELLKQLQGRKNDEYEFQIMEMTKRNDNHKTSLCVRQRGNAIGVNLYMDDLVRRYETKDCDMEALVEDILVQLKERLLDSSFTATAMEQLSVIRDYEVMKDRVLFRIVNEEANREYLKNSVYVPFLDFAICFYLVVGDGEDTGTIHLTKDMFNTWGVSVEEVYQQAMKNTPILMPYQFKNIADILSGMMAEDSFSEFMNPPEFDEKNFSMWVLGNEKQMFGAGAILYEGLMKEISERIGAEDIVILPSSVHECILLPLTDAMDTYYLRSMVHEVNVTNVEPEDRLSENVYLYSRTSAEISILTE